MFTYSMWKSFISEFNKYTTNFNKFETYSILAFFSLPTILIDILFLPFQILGIIIFLITRKRGK